MSQLVQILNFKGVSNIKQYGECRTVSWQMTKDLQIAFYNKINWQKYAHKMPVKERSSENYIN